MRFASTLLHILVLHVWASLAPTLSAVELTPIPPTAQRRLASVRVQVAPDHADWTYAAGEPVRFRIQVIADSHPVPDAVVTYTIAPENTRGETITAAVPQDGLVVQAGTMMSPGFLRCVAETNVAGRTYRGLATVACAPEKIVPGQSEPADFDAFWQRSKEQLAAVPLEPVLTLLPESCTDKLNVYHVSFRTLGTNPGRAARLYGILCEPKAPGHYPALLRLPGAGVRPYRGDKATAERGFITLEIGIHGIPVNLPQEIYDQLQAGVLNNYWRFNLDDRDAYYFRRVYLGCLRANDLLTSRPSWDGRNLIAAGASQGGQLAIVTAALDPRVTALLAVHPGLCDLTPARLHFRATGELLPYSAVKLAQSPHATPAKRSTIAYYDTVNFARRVRVPGCYLWGYNDEVCTPSSLYAAYNVIIAPKTLELMLEQGHSYPPEQWDALQGWLTAHLARR